MMDMTGHGSSAPVGEPKHVSPARLIGTLSGFGAVAGLLIVLAFQWAHPRITAYQARVLHEAVKEVLGDPATADSVMLPGGERVFAGYDQDHKLVGYAIVGAEPGFADVITVIFGYDPARKRLLGMKVLDNKETPGLGDKIVKDTLFVRGFTDAATPLLGVKRGAGKGAENEVDMITGATISSRAVIGIINRKLAKVEPLLPKEPQP